MATETAERQKSMMFVRVAAATQRARLAESKPGEEKYTEWWVARVLEAIEEEDFVVVRKWVLNNINAGLVALECHPWDEPGE